MAECGWFPSPLLVVKCLELYRLFSKCGNCYFILTLLGVCHETVNFVLPLTFPRNRFPLQITAWH